MRRKLALLQLRQEDALADIDRFEQQLQAAGLSPVEMKTYEICKLRVFDVYPLNVRNDATRVRKRYSQTHVNGRVYRFPLRKADGKQLAARIRKRKASPAKSEPTNNDGTKVEEHSANDASPNNSQVLDEDSLAARRTKRENAGKRGGVPSKYVFDEGRINFSQRKYSYSPATSSTADDKSMVKSADW